MGPRLAIMDTVKAILSVLQHTERAKLQNTLMRIPDKICAAALSALDAEARSAVYGLIGGAKAARIEEEIGLEARRRTSSTVKNKLVHSFFTYFEPEGKQTLRPYIRPTRRRPER